MSVALAGHCSDTLTSSAQTPPAPCRDQTRTPFSSSAAWAAFHALSATLSGLQLSKQCCLDFQSSNPSGVFSLDAYPHRRGGWRAFVSAPLWCRCVPSSRFLSSPRKARLVFGSLSLLLLLSFRGSSGLHFCGVLWTVLCSFGPSAVLPQLLQRS